jgi:hypothetical protein
MSRRDDAEAAQSEHPDAAASDEGSQGATRRAAETPPTESGTTNGSDARDGANDDGLFGPDDDAVERPPLEPGRPSVENVLFVLAGALATVLLLLTTIY